MFDYDLINDQIEHLPSYSIMIFYNLSLSLKGYISYFWFIMNSRCRVGRTARLGEKGESLLFLQPVEIDYLQELETHGVSLTECPVLKVLDSFPLYGQKNYIKKSVFLDSHPWVLCLQKALEAFIMSKVIFTGNLIELCTLLCVLFFI